ncbi:protein disulfide-isomerase TMX3 [Coccinella septempunctata]|uniref:protein disulfide-isomerase TMX3 n=1 Tax=Coccinella septempunctata TaxID=41139 RepID=UPI001D07C750|nr:protein disulfide-isomerase TMX3 [Coccinella septempunctata]
MNLLFKFLVIVSILVNCSGSKVLELSDKFPTIRKQGNTQWLVMFYAPWCGHCKRLEPVWAQVSQALYRTNLRVGRIDCTRFTSIASEFSISGFPTIKFITSDNDFTYHGDRNKEDIINFALRMAGPPVQQVTRPESLANLKGMNQLFFMYVGDQEGPLWDSFNNVATKMQPHSFFYVTTKEIAGSHVNISRDLPAVFVHKDNLHYFYSIDMNSSDPDHLNNTMYNWINEERFATFPKITRGNINEILQTKKYIVLAVVEEDKAHEVPQDMLRFRNMVESVISKNREKYHRYFQFGWVGNPELANSIAMKVLPLPYLLVLNSTTNHHHIPEEEDALQMTTEYLEDFLERIHNQSAPVYGGNSLIVRLYRTYFEARTSLSDMWRGNPVLTTVLFGLPLGFLSLILYSICCADILDADEDEEEELLHEKKE